MKRALHAHHVIFTPDKPRFKGKYAQNPSVEDVTKFLNAQGEDAQIIDGFYDEPERSILVQDPKNLNGIMQMATDFGQESVIHSNKGENALHYVNGPQKGQKITGQGTNFYHSKPANNFSTIHTVDGPLYFHHNLNFPDDTKKTELEKGLRGDWSKEGYTISHTDREPSGYFTVSAFDSSGKEVGNVQVGHHGKRGLFSNGTYVEPEHRRKGLAGAMYQHAEKITGRKFVPSDDQSTDGEYLWSQPSRPFGKSEDLQKAPLRYDVYDQSKAKEEGLPDLMNSERHMMTKKVKLPNGLEYRQFRPSAEFQNHMPRSSMVHAIYHPSNEFEPMAYMETRNEEDPMAEGGMHPNVVHWSEVAPEHRGKGVGRQLYLASLLHGVGQITSGANVSPEAHKAWKSFRQVPGIGGRIARYPSSEADHFMSPGEAASYEADRHHIFVRDKAQVDMNKAFPKISLDPKLAASEDLEKAPVSEGQVLMADSWLYENNRRARTNLYNSIMQPKHKNDRLMMQNELIKRLPKSSIKTIGGAVHILAHRTSSGKELDGDYSTVSHDGPLSYTVDRGIAENMRHWQRHKYGVEPKVHSAWIPLNNVAYSFNDAHHVGGNFPTNNLFFEHEIIVKPGTYKSHIGPESKPAKIKLPSGYKKLAASEDMKKSISSLDDIRAKLEAPNDTETINIPEHMAIQWAIPPHRWEK